MKIVIEIPDRIYKIIQTHRTLNIMDDEILENALSNGVPLPEHHGRLIDADWVKNSLDIYVIREYDGQFIRRNDIDSVPTIIEGGVIRNDR